MRTRIKFCGITRAEDALYAASLGADALGLVFYPPSPRSLSLERAIALSEAIPPFVTRVALFLDERADVVGGIVEQLRPDLLQFHGSESADYCASFGRPYIKALACGVGADSIEKQMDTYSSAIGFLLDSHSPGQAGGSGKHFDWSQVPKKLDKPIVLAGGLHAANVGEAIQTVHPYAVDVSSGVESSPGIKDRNKMHSFIAQVRSADAS